MQYSKLYSIILITMIFLGLVPVAHCNIEIRNDATWHQGDHPQFPISEPVIIFEGACLVIQEGLEVTFTGGSNTLIWVKPMGKLIARGTRLEWIVLRGADEDRGDWGGIIIGPDLLRDEDDEFYGDDNWTPATAHFEWCIIRDGGARAPYGNVVTRNGRMTMYMCEVTNSLHHGLVMSDYFDRAENLGLRINGSEWFDYNDHDLHDDDFDEYNFCGYSYGAGDGYIRGVEKTRIWNNGDPNNRPYLDENNGNLAGNCGIYIHQSWILDPLNHHEHSEGRKLIRQCDIRGNDFGIFLTGLSSNGQQVRPLEDDIEHGSLHEWITYRPDHNAHNHGNDEFDEEDYNLVAHPLEVSNCFIYNNNFNGLRIVVDGYDDAFHTPEDGAISAWNNIFSHNGHNGGIDDLRHNVAFAMEGDGSSPWIPPQQFMHNVIWDSRGDGLRIMAYNTSQGAFGMDEDYTDDNEAVYNNIFGPTYQNKECVHLDFPEGAGLSGDVHLRHNAFKNYDEDHYFGGDERAIIDEFYSVLDSEDPFNINNEGSHSLPGHFNIEIIDGDQRCQLLYKGVSWMFNPVNGNRFMAPLSEIYYAVGLEGGRPHNGIRFWDPSPNENPYEPPDIGCFGGALAKGFHRWDWHGLYYGQFPYRYIFCQDWIHIEDDWDVEENPVNEYYIIIANRRLRRTHPELNRSQIEDGPMTVVCGSGVLLTVSDDEPLKLGDDSGSLFNFISVSGLDYTGPWQGFKLIGSSVINSQFKDCYISGANCAINLDGVNGTGPDRVEFDNCTIEDCGTGISANNSRAAITNTEIIGSYGTSGGNAIYLKNCTAGQVIIDNCDITGNGYDNTYLSGAIYCFNSDPEIINTEVYLNNGTGVTCIGSSPDLDAYDAVSHKSNEIRDNGPESPYGSNGAEIYLDYQSTPDINYNNIYHCDTGPPFTAKGYAIYMDVLNTSTIDAKNNWWGTSTPETYENDLFHVGTGFITYSPYASSAYTVANAEAYELAMGLWSRGEYARAAHYFRRTVADTGAIGINSVHYLTGCVGEMENGDFNDLRDFLLEAADRHRDERVSRVAERWATHCLTEMREYVDAMEEYDDRAQNADCLRDSVMAVIDYIAVEELYNGDRINASGEDYMKQTHKLMSLLDRQEDSEALSPETFAVARAYPNPFNSMTNIAFNLKDDSYVKLTVHDLQGREVSALYEGQETSGVHSLSWDASGLASGVYICRLQSDSKMATIKLVMVR
ncbi:MAG: T9SS type A sorting domain-containing protein [Candidatus Hatepunaea meridiana]|nr:T9SS type A sorting domain-containing protein [Candidatus Hatepunaea meridiana]